MSIPKCLVTCVILACCTAQQVPEERYKLLRPEPKLAERFRWNRLDFQFKNDAERQNALENRSYIPDNTIPFGVGVWEDKVFITIPRRNPGVPSTLNYINLSKLLNKYESKGYSLSPRKNQNWHYWVRRDDE